MPSGTIQDQYGVRARSHLRTDLLEMLIHRFGIDGGHDDGGTNASFRAYGGEYMYRVMPVVPYHGRT
jgi:outer membrane protease